MQTFVIAVLIIIAGLIGALLFCATSLISRARLATTTLRRIEETLLAMNRVRAIDSAIKSAEPVRQSQTAEAGGTSASFLTLRELKAMSGGTRPATGSAPITNPRKPPRTYAPQRPVTHPQRVPARGSTPAVQSADIVTREAVAAGLDGVDSMQTTDELAKREPHFEVSDVTPALQTPDASEHRNDLEASIEVSWPGLHQQILNLELQKETDGALVHENLSVVSAVTHTAPAANGELPIADAGGAVQEAAVAISPARPEPARSETPSEVSTPNGDTRSGPDAGMAVGSTVVGESRQPVREEKTASTGNDLDETRRKKKEQELMMIISSRRRRARAGR
jgi:hypothetical protein